MARRYFGWTTVRFRKPGVRNIRRYRRYGRKTYLIGKYTKVKPR